MTNTQEQRAEIAKSLRELGVSGVLVQAAEQGLISKLECAMPRCLCPEEVGGRTYFEQKEHPPIDWMPTPDHYPVLKMNGGQLTVDNVRLAHRLCNRVDYAIQIGKPYDRDLARVEAFRKRAAEKQSDPQ